MSAWGARSLIQIVPTTHTRRLWNERRSHYLGNIKDMSVEFLV